eukprot:3136915-Rhodomonas_salina.2
MSRTSSLLCNQGPTLCPSSATRANTIPPSSLLFPFSSLLPPPSLALPPPHPCAMCNLCSPGPSSLLSSAPLHHVHAPPQASSLLSHLQLPTLFLLSLPLPPSPFTLCTSNQASNNDHDVCCHHHHPLSLLPPSPQWNRMEAGKVGWVGGGMRKWQRGVGCCDEWGGCGEVWGVNLKVMFGP